jgi:hypothetical protein
MRTGPADSLALARSSFAALLVAFQFKFYPVGGFNNTYHVRNAGVFY